jgi:hypothetical protein
LDGALHEAETGFPAAAQTGSALTLGPARFAQVLAGVALARGGDPKRAIAVADDLAKNHVNNMIIQSYWVPVIRAAVALDANNPSAAVEQLRPAAAYELGANTQLQYGLMYPNCLRSLAYLRLKDGSQAAAEFQNILDHPGVVLNATTGALARLQFARAKALAGDNAKARAAYQDFLALWKDANPDVPILKQATAEYAKLQ